MVISNWIKYAQWEESQKQIQRARYKIYDCYDHIFIINTLNFFWQKADEILYQRMVYYSLSTIFVLKSHL